MGYQHYLISIDNIHAYLVTNDKHDIERTADRMVTILENANVKFLPIVLATHLTTGSDFVRALLRRESPEVKQKLDARKGFHLTVFALSPEHPSHAKLMALH